jgi:hypothetical protein
MVNYPSTEIVISPLDDKHKLLLENVRDYFRANGDDFYKNSHNPEEKDNIYFMGDSVVHINELSDKANIRILGSGQQSLTSIETALEDILEGD